MKKVLLIGDSIQMGYQKFVRAALEDVAEVYGMEGNAQFSLYTLRWINIWKKDESWPDDMDLVHWNTGLWDVLRICGDDTHTPIEIYGKTLVRIHNRLKILFPKAKQIFALSTTVVEEGYDYPYQRYNSDIDNFNSEAIKALEPLGVEINDLNSITKNIPDSCRSDMTHFYTPRGIELVGGKVLDAISASLDIPRDKIKELSAVVPTLLAKNVGN